MDAGIFADLTFDLEGRTSNRAGGGFLGDVCDGSPAVGDRRAQ
jgi:hypothetical protein